nr:hypothetical protein CFP56_70512 [Quercus suber]
MAIEMREHIILTFVNIAAIQAKSTIGATNQFMMCINQKHETRATYGQMSAVTERDLNALCTVMPQDKQLDVRSEIKTCDCQLAWSVTPRRGFVWSSYLPTPLPMKV